MKPERTWISWGAGVVAVILALTVPGCDDVDVGRALVITPGTSTIEGQDATVLLTAEPAEDSVTSSNLNSAIYLPLEWSVSDGRLGRIESSGGYGAVYTSTGIVGQNSIQVRDQSGAEGVAVVNQSAPDEEDDEEEDAEI